jgi:DNA-binding transcriptional LysR family regulator
MYDALFQGSGLSFDRLRSLCQIEKAGSITRAAKSVAPGNPTAKQAQFSRQTKDLEGFFKIEILDRDVQPYRLTPEGKRLAALAHEMLGKLDDFTVSCGDLPVQLTMAAGESLIQWILLPLLKDFRKQLPAASITFLNRQSNSIAKGLINGDIDLGLIRQSALTKQLEGYPLTSAGFRLYAPSRIGKKLGETVDAKDLQKIPLAILEGGGEFRTAIDELSSQASSPLTFELECSSSTQVAYAVTSLGYAGILPEFAAPVLGKAVTTHKIKGFTLKRTLTIAWNPRRAESLPTIKAAVDTLKRLIGKR